MDLDTLTIVGVGLIGGSAGLAARERRVARHILGVGRSAAGIDAAIRLGAITAGTCDLADAARQSDLILFCTPVDQIVKPARVAAAACRPGTLLTDAGSTKEFIVRELDGMLPPQVAFVGGHPLAGSEKRGPEYARADLFEGRVVVLTPTPNTDPGAVDRVAMFWQRLGANIKFLSPREHDDALAITSHVPHLVAAALAGTLPDHLRDLTATGFRDTTRIAAGDPDLWAAVFAQNREAVLTALERFSDRLAAFRAALAQNDMTAVRRLLAEANLVRESLHGH